MYEDFVREKEKKEREAKKAERKKRMAAFRQVLDSTKSIKVGLAKHFCEWVQDDHWKPY